MKMSVTSSQPQSIREQRRRRLAYYSSSHAGSSGGEAPTPKPVSLSHVRWLSVRTPLSEWIIVWLPAVGAPCEDHSA